jgi:diguanylate cyclase (GGDEF)-like protein/PAS domain S-box-containing protein
MNDLFFHPGKMAEAFMDIVSDACFLVDFESMRIIAVNALACEMTGYEREELVGMEMTALLPEIAEGDLSRLFGGLGSGSLAIEKEMKRKDGSVFTSEIRAAVTENEGREILLILARGLSGENKGIHQGGSEKGAFESLFAHSPDAVCVLDASGRVLDVNPAFTELFGCKREETVGRLLEDVFGYDRIRQEIRENVRKVNEKGYVEHETWRRTKDGREIYLALRGVSVDWINGTKAIYAIYRDMTKQQEAFRSLEQEKIYWENLFFRSPLAIALINADNRIMQVNHRFEELFGYSNHEIAGCNIDDLLAPGKAKQDAVEISRKVHQGTVSGLERKRRRKDGTWVDVEIMGLPFKVGGQFLAYGMYQDISERKEAERKILYLGLRDGLTGLYNQAYLERELDRLDRSDFLPLGIIMLDVDNLKLINDAFGHLEGNRQIRRTAELLRESCRETDIYGRWGGDEFLLIMPNSAPDFVKVVRDRLRRALRKDPDGFAVPLSVSVGMAVKEDVRQSLADIRKKAEEEMYRDKLLCRTAGREVLFKAIERRLDEDPGRNPHVTRVLELADRFAIHLGLDPRETKRLELLARYHDIGNVTVPREVLKKPGPIDEAEWRIVRRHAELGYQIARNLAPLADIADEILHHHERYDGTGYPVGLSGEDIPFLSRVYSIIDAFDAMTGYRVFREPLKLKDALEELEFQAGSQFDPSLAASFSEMIRFSEDLS